MTGSLMVTKTTTVFPCGGIVTPSLVIRSSAARRRIYLHHPFSAPGAQRQDLNLPRNPTAPNGWDFPPLQRSRCLCHRKSKFFHDQDTEEYTGPHHLALLFVVFAMGALVQPLPVSEGRAPLHICPRGGALPPARARMRSAEPAERAGEAEHRDDTDAAFNEPI